jgi:hypothetical protein
VLVRPNRTRSVLDAGGPTEERPRSVAGRR